MGICLATAAILYVDRCSRIIRKSRARRMDPRHRRHRLADPVHCRPAIKGFSRRCAAPQPVHPQRLEVAAVASTSTTAIDAGRQVQRRPETQRELPARRHLDDARHRTHHALRQLLAGVICARARRSCTTGSSYAILAIVVSATSYMANRDPDALRGMRTGYVPASWAKREHKAWAVREHRSRVAANGRREGDRRQLIGVRQDGRCVCNRTSKRTGPMCPSTSRTPVMMHRWDTLTFLHWSYEPDVVARLLPVAPHARYVRRQSVGRARFRSTCGCGRRTRRRCRGRRDFARPTCAPTCSTNTAGRASGSSPSTRRDSAPCSRRARRFGCRTCGRTCHCARPATRSRTPAPAVGPGRAAQRASVTIDIGTPYQPAELTAARPFPDRALAAVQHLRAGSLAPIRRLRNTIRGCCTARLLGTCDDELVAAAGLAAAGRRAAGALLARGRRAHRAAAPTDVDVPLAPR